ncbi:hypothetical protein [Pseudomonas sp. NFX1]|jgi:hypothetical protein|uniref:hypothetical protein n=1 Tax=Pseudomonas sp. NFX1 TaxID=2201355 RepID=UPI003DA76B57
MTTETLNIEVSWPDTLDVPAGATVNAQIWVGNEVASYRLISDSDVDAPATTSPATIAFTYDTEDLLPEDAETVWDHFHTSPYLMHDGKRLNIERVAKISVSDAQLSGWKIAIS